MTKPLHGADTDLVAFAILVVSAGDWTTEIRFGLSDANPDSGPAAAVGHGPRIQGLRIAKVKRAEGDPTGARPAT